jgi:tRNA G18 (ribose-2'-O)-methylase SpoU
MASGLPTDDIQVAADVHRDGNVIVRDVSKDDEKKKVDLTASKNVLLLVGNEGFGIPKELLEFCDKNVILGSNRKLHRNVDSLNVSVATALILQFLKNKYIH